MSQGPLTNSAAVPHFFGIFLVLLLCLQKSSLLPFMYLPDYIDFPKSIPAHFEKFSQLIHIPTSSSLSVNTETFCDKSTANKLLAEGDNSSKLSLKRFMFCVNLTQRICNVIHM